MFGFVKFITQSLSQMSHVCITYKNVQIFFLKEILIELQSMVSIKDTFKPAVTVFLSTC